MSDFLSPFLTERVEVKMLRIGEFSRLSQVTIKALRYYDDMGLLKPAEIDSFTGYRYYSVEQLPQIHRIIAFKELGLSLEQIAVMLDDDLSSEQIRDILHEQQEQIKQRIQAEQSHLAQVEFRLRMIEMENNMSPLEVIVKPILAFRALTLRMSIHGDSNHVRNTLLAFQREVEHALVQHSIKLAGPLTEIRYAEEFLADYQDVEIVLPVDDGQTSDVPLETAGILKLITVPALSMAATHIHRSTDATRMDTGHISEVMPVLQRWIVDNGYQLLGTHRTLHHIGPFQHAEYEDWLTEFQHEIAPLD
ncbi:MAG: MerR family transcriptional regulator [Burkholderiales bacterium]|nr:MerR family transcriptional regulator [Anaerolineae bacterium]